MNSDAIEPIAKDAALTLVLFAITVLLLFRFLTVLLM